MAKSRKPSDDTNPLTIEEEAAIADTEAPAAPAFEPGQNVVRATPADAVDTVVSYNPASGLLFLASDPFKGHLATDWKVCP